MSIQFLDTVFPNRIILASSPLTETAEHIKKCEKFGAGGAILKTCYRYTRKKDFEKRKVLFTSDRKNYYASSSFDREILSADEGLTLYHDAVKTCSIPIIPSITALSLDPEDWLPLCLSFQDAGAPILQLDFFYLENFLLQTDFSEKLFMLFNTLRHSLSCRIMPKININLPAGYIFPLISRAGIKGVSLLDSVRVPVTDTPDGSSLPFSSTSLFGGWQLPLSLHYTYIAKQYGLDVCGGGGVTNRSCVTQIMSVGADLVQIASAILLNGYGYLQDLQPDTEEKKIFSPAKFPAAYRIQKNKCSHCQLCTQSAWCDAVYIDDDGMPSIHKELCDACGWCAVRCPSGAIEGIT